MTVEALAPEITASETQEPTLRETIEEAVDTHADAPAGEHGAGPAETGVPKQEVRPAVGAEGRQPEGAKPPAAPGAAGPAVDPATGKPVQQVPQELKAPSQWKPAVREKWNSLPREVQEEVLRREHDNLRLIGSVGQKIRLADEVSQHIAPFMETMQARGATPQQFINDVFSTTKVLASGNAQEKAEVVANIVQSYGIDLKMLDQVLAGRLSAPPPDPRLIEMQRQAQQLQGRVMQYETQKQQQVHHGAATMLQEFASDPKNEFFDDVRDMMADLIETGKAQTLQDAYTASIWANPDTRKILLQREAEQRAASRGRRAEVARRASSSVHGTPRGAGGPPGNTGMSLRETIAAAIDAQESA